MARELLDIKQLHKIEQQRQKRLAEKQQAEEQQRIADEVRNKVLSQIARSLHAANEQTREAQRKASLKRQEQAPIKEKGSPIENTFYVAWCAAYPLIEIKRQYPIGKYRVDFAHLETKTAIELDGHSFHSHKQDRNRDYARQHDIESQGWYILRFTGSQVWSDVESCIDLADSRIMARHGR